MDIIRDTQTYDLKVAAGETVDLSVHGQSLRINNASTSFKVQVNNGSKIAMTAGKGFTVKNPDGFQNLKFINESVSDITISADVGWSEVKDDSLILNGSVNVISGTNTTSGVKSITTTASKILDSSNIRTSVVFQNNDVNEIWIGSSNVDIATKKGYCIKANGVFTWAGQGEIWAVTNSTANLSYIISEV